MVLSEGDVECFSEYMELWIHRMRIEGLRLWLSGTLRIPASLASLDHLNLQLSVCGFSLHRDAERNYVFRVMYSGCFVQQEHGDFVIVLNLLKRVGRFGGRPNTFAMKCPVATAPPSAEHIRCNPNFIQLRWSLALRGKLVVALEDASLIQLNTEVNGSSITVQGKRRDIMSLEMVMEKYEEFLPLKLVSGHYAYSMEASCPSVSRSPAGETVLHIFKRRMGLTKRGGYDSETLSVSDVSVTQTSSFSVSESRDFVELTIPTAHILQTKNCTGPAGEALLQTFFRVDAVLTFKEMPQKVNWSMENVSPCTEVSPGVPSQNVQGNMSHVTSVSTGAAPSAVAQGTISSDCGRGATHTDQSLDSRDPDPKEGGHRPGRLDLSSPTVSHGPPQRRPVRRAHGERVTGGRGCVHGERTRRGKNGKRHHRRTGAQAQDLRTTADLQPPEREGSGGCCSAASVALAPAFRPLRFRSNGGDYDSEPTTPPATASGQRPSPDVQAGSFGNASRSVARPVNGTASWWRTLAVVAGLIADFGVDRVTPLNSSDGLWSGSVSRKDGPESPTAWVNSTESP
ncbi:hypothetical protein AAFF_G00233330 [Aldrovandia affinis]|uniref:CIROZ beta domain-containing protein n=1 Tax=Aldrovandia affinis TaxID=143900 RepID=A0AAD7RHK0_9TELE|nr:hypothetical protein AAFF_G00233330 [Aldrovandia affinis]